MLTYPQFDPVAISIGPLQIHWYGLMYLAGFLSAWGLAKLRAKRYQLPWSGTDIADLIFYAAMGVIIGGRVGYMLFYAFDQLIHSPLSLFKVWDGGMSFHGGLLGVIGALFIFAKRFKKTFWQVTDFAAPLVPIGLALGRIGNFINGELWGRVTDVPWAMVFPHVDGNPRHPSQLYELAFEGVILFSVMWWYAAKPRKPGQVSAVFLILYGVFRFFVEFFRQPDPQLGFIAFNWLTMGQLLCVPMIVLGFVIYFWPTKSNN